MPVLVRHYAYEVDRETGCWEMLKQPNNKGYVQICPKPYTCTLAHRFSYENSVGTIPDGMLVLHRCDNRICANPSHLFLGTSKQNSEDMVQKGRSCAGERHGGATLTDSDIVRILDLRADGHTLQSIADEFSTGRSHIWKIVNRKQWKHVANATSR